MGWDICSLLALGSQSFLRLQQSDGVQQHIEPGSLSIDLPQRRQPPPTLLEIVMPLSSRLVLLSGVVVPAGAFLVGAYVALVSLALPMHFA